MPSATTSGAELPAAVDKGGVPLTATRPFTDAPTSRPARATSAKEDQGRFFKMQFSPLRNRKTLGSAGGTSIGPGRRRLTVQPTSHDSTAGGGDALGLASTLPGNSANEAKLRALEDHLNTMPVDGRRPNRLGVDDVALVDDDEPVLMSTVKKGRVAVAPSATTTAATLNKEAVAKRQKLDVWISVAEKGNTKMRTENAFLERLALVTQENCLDNDAKFEEALAQLRSGFEFAEVFRQDASATVKNVDERMTGIRQLISELVTTAERKSQQEHEAVRSAFQRQLEEQKAQLDLVRENGKNTTHEWKEKNANLQAQLEAVLLETQTTYEKLNKLQAESQRLRVEFSAQSGDAEMLEDEYRRVFTRHQRLKERLHTVEGELAARGIHSERLIGTASSATEGGVGPSAASLQGELVAAAQHARLGTATSQEEEDREQAFQVALKKAQLLFEVEAANLKSVREAHLHTLRQRTELEVFLRQQVSKQRQKKLQSGDARASAAAALVAEASKGSSVVQLLAKELSQGKDSLAAAVSEGGARVVTTMGGGAPVALTVEDRKETIDQLLSSRRVLQLLFEEEASGDLRAVARAGSGSQRADTPPSIPVMKMVDDVMNPVAREERELNHMYRSWKEWTERANREVFGESCAPTTTHQ